jgi:hypothetical protein
LDIAEPGYQLISDVEVGMGVPGHNMMKKKRIIIKDIPKSKLGRKAMHDVTGGSEWKYLNVQRFHAYIDPSISNDTCWNLYNGGKG